ncbi:MAG: PD-(D/E)XK nuclease family protein [Pirellulales bacterium]
MVGNPPPDHDTLLNAFWEGWRSRAETAAIRLGKGDDLDSIGKTADRVITAFRASEFAQPQGRILGVEEELRSPLIPGLPDILGRIDLIVETDEALKIVDLKTARTRWSTEQAERSGEQLMLYAALAKDLVPGKPIHWSSPLSRRRPTRSWKRSRSRGTQRGSTARGVMAKVWSAIEAGNFFPAPSPTACPTCPFRAECAAWQG